MKVSWIAVVIIILIGFGLSAYFLDDLPEQVPSHWNSKGEIDSYMPKNIMVWLMPGVTVFIAALLYFIPRIDPLKKNYAAFQDYFEGFIVVISAFFLLVHALTIAAGLGHEFAMNQFVMPAVGLLMLYIALLLRKAKRNWFVGIRTPWTLSSDVVWDKTHRMGSYAFAALGVIFMIMIFVPDSLGLMLPVILVFALSPVAYSYYVWTQEKKK